MLRRSLLLLSVLLVTLTVTVTATGCGRGPDIHGRVTLGPGVAAPESGELILEASPVTRMTEVMTVYPLRLDVARLTFPFEFELHGNGKEPVNKSWSVTARVQNDPAQVLLEGSGPIHFKCDADGDNCEAGPTTAVLTAP